jgi:hypothetical protein
MRQAACDRYSAAASTDLKRPMSPHARTDADRAHNPACSILRQRQIPRSSRRRPPEAPAGARESPQRQDRRARSCRESPPIPAQPNRRDQPATPEIAGSSPVAPTRGAMCCGSSAPSARGASLASLMRQPSEKTMKCQAQLPGVLPIAVARHDQRLSWG